MKMFLFKLFAAASNQLNFLKSTSPRRSCKRNDRNRTACTEEALIRGNDATESQEPIETDQLSRCSKDDLQDSSHDDRIIHSFVNHLAISSHAITTDEQAHSQSEAMSPEKVKQAFEDLVNRMGPDPESLYDEQVITV